MKLIVLGAGAWGTALAVGACSNPVATHHVTLWARDPGQAELLKQHRENQRYLPGIALLGNLPDAIQISTTFSAAISPASLHQAEAQGLLQFLASGHAADAIRKQGMVPAGA